MQRIYCPPQYQYIHWGGEGKRRQAIAMSTDKGRSTVQSFQDFYNNANL